MKRRVWPFCFLMLMSVAATGQSNTAPLGARVKMRWQGDNVLFTEGANTHQVSLHEKYVGVRLDKVTLQSAKEAGGFIYLVLDVTGPSKLPRDSHQCGGGNESNLIWLKLDQDWKVLDSKDFLYDSCWRSESATMIDPPKWTGDTLRAATLDKVVTYTYKHPEDGLKVTDAPADK
jgi:hypothetical protein